MNLPSDFSLSALEEEIINDNLADGMNGLRFLLENAEAVDKIEYGRLLKLAGFKDPEKQSIDHFIYDSLSLTPDDFYDTWGVNFWIARSMNIQVIAGIYNELGMFMQVNYLLDLAKRIKEDRS